MHDQYLTYEEYQNYGGTMSSADFTLFEFRARKRIDYLTDMRVQAMQTVPEAVKLAIMAIIPIDQKAGAEAQAAPAVSSFNTDGYSESYGSRSMSVKDAEASMNEIVRNYLYGEKDDEGVPLLYRGVCGY